MTDSQGSEAARRAGGDQRPGKRERLVAAAVQLLHQQGIERTTLAEMAQAADVPVGNVYYYFKTKDEIVAAVVDAHIRQVSAMLDTIDARHRSPKARLKALVGELAGQSETVAQFGCPLGSLCSEIDKRIDAGEYAVAELMRTIIDWAEAQYRALGQGDESGGLAVDMLAAYQGNALLANTLHDHKILSAAARRLEHRIDEL
jgi:TetR/AcrR family transcriptional regulator, transcriptional repressor for nem operon